MYRTSNQNINAFKLYKDIRVRKDLDLSADNEFRTQQGHKIRTCQTSAIRELQSINKSK